MSTFMRKITAVVMCGLLATALVGLSGCNSGVAATVNGEKIMEQKVTDYITHYRDYAGYTDDAAWATFMSQGGYTASDLRTDIINMYAEEIVVRGECEKQGITVNADDVNSSIESTRTQYGYTDDAAWEETLSSMGYTPDDYYAEVELGMLKTALEEANVSAPDDAKFQEFAEQYGSSYTGKKSSHILFKTDSSMTDEQKAEKRAQAEAVLAELQASTDLATDFPAKAQAVSEDTSAADGGNVGWDFMNSFVEPYTTALDALDKGQMSGIVESDYGYHIIYCTDSFQAGDDGVVKYADMPEEIKTQFAEDVTSYLTSQDGQTYIDGLVDEADIKIFDMPKNLPYDVDMSLADTTATDGTTSTGTTTTDGTTSTGTTTTDGTTSTGTATDGTTSTGTTTTDGTGSTGTTTDGTGSTGATTTEGTTSTGTTTTEGTTATGTASTQQ